MFRKQSNPFKAVEVELKKKIKEIEEDVRRTLQSRGQRIDPVDLGHLLQWFDAEIQHLNNAYKQFGVVVRGVINMKEEKCRITYTIPKTMRILKR